MRFRSNTSSTLRGHRAFADVLSQGRTRTSGPVRCYYLISDDVHGPSLNVGFAVTRGVRKAALRNRIKRLLREAFRAQEHRLLAALQKKQRGLRSVFFYRSPAAGKAGEIRLSHVEPGMTALVAELQKTL